jgi:hypothetical protein
MRRVRRLARPKRRIARAAEQCAEEDEAVGPVDQVMTVTKTLVAKGCEGIECHRV